VKTTTITDIARCYGISISQVRRRLAAAKRKGRRLTDADFLDDLSEPPKPLGNEEHLALAELIVLVEKLHDLVTLWSLFAGAATGERCFTAYQKGRALRLEREERSKGKNRRGKLPMVELHAAADDAELVRWFFRFGFGSKGTVPKKSGRKGGRPRTTVAGAAETLRAKTAKRVKDSPVTKDGGWVASKDNSARERARKSVR
jgi:hypothetical protein